MIDYKKRFVEVDEIIKYLPKKDLIKIPNDLIDLIRENKDSKYIWKYDSNKKLEEQNIHKDTIAILSYINMKYILEDNQKMLMKNLHDCNEMKSEKLKREKFNPETVFKKHWFFTTKYHKMIKRGENTMLEHIYKYVIKNI